MNDTGPLLLTYALDSGQTDQVDEPVVRAYDTTARQLNFCRDVREGLGVTPSDGSGAETPVARRRATNFKRTTWTSSWSGSPTIVFSGPNQANHQEPHCTRTSVKSPQPQPHWGQ